MPDESFETFLIRFGDRDEFEKAVELTTLAMNVIHGDMLLVYDNEFFRDRFSGYLAMNEITHWNEINHWT